jgi:hypothetical protein
MSLGLYAALVEELLEQRSPPCSRAAEAGSADLGDERATAGGEDDHQPRGELP